MTQVFDDIRPGLAAPPERGFRPEVQALRAAAVLGVVLFHFWPGMLRGGYVGVDVFFVISGYLITSGLLREVAATGGLRLREFWARRIRRLLPAALFVIAVSTALTFLVVPQGYWAQYFKELAASAWYVENWVLAGDAVDYLNSQNDPSLAQHYWSLSVEEQFYLFWPLLVATVCLITRRRREARLSAIRVIVLAVLVVSLASSVYVTATNPSAAYFVTYARAWEFAFGALVAVAPAGWRRCPDSGAPALRFLGWAAIGGAMVWYTELLSFPGWIAVVPVAGTALVIWCGTSPPATFWSRLVESKPVQRVGEVSYSMYLWHWPLAVLLPNDGGLWGTQIRGVGGILASFALASLTLRYVENPLRFHPAMVRSAARTFGAGLAGMLLVGAAAATGMLLTRHAATADTRRASELITQSVRCFGADAFLGGTHPCVNHQLAGSLVPQLAGRSADTDGAFNCYATEAQTTGPNAHPRICHFGSPAKDALRVAVVGDSHAASLLPGLRGVAVRAHWSVDAMVGWGGVLAAPTAGDTMAGYRNALAAAVAAGHYDVVLVTALRSDAVGQGKADRLSGLMATAWKPLLQAGAKVVAVADNPWLTAAAQECIDRATGGVEAANCKMTPAAAWKLPDPLSEAVRRAGAGASLVDLSDAYCNGSSCPLVIGHVLVYRDANHITATYSKTLAPFLIARIKEAIA